MIFLWRCFWYWVDSRKYNTDLDELANRIRQAIDDAVA